MYNLYHATEAVMSVETKEGRRLSQTKFFLVTPITERFYPREWHNGNRYRLTRVGGCYEVFFKTRGQATDFAKRQRGVIVDADTCT